MVYSKIVMAKTIFPFLIAHGGRLALVFVGVALVWPWPAYGQASVRSDSFILDTINFGSIFALTTGQESIPPVIFEGPNASEISHGKATITWKTDKKSTSSVAYGLTTTYGLDVGTADLVTDHSVILSGLEPSTTYHYKVKSADALGASNSSGDAIFTTTAEQGITNIRLSDITYTSALISWTTDNATKESVRYGKSIAYDKTVEGQSLSFTTNHTVKLDNLDAGSDYHAQIVATSESGEISRSNDLLFTTLANPNFVRITVAIVSENRVTINWQTNVPTSGIVAYKSDQDTKELTAGETKQTIDHATSLDNLFGSSLYRFSVTAIDAQGKQVVSLGETFRTPDDRTPPQISALKVSATRAGETLILTATWRSNEPAKSQVAFNPKNNRERVTTTPESANFVSEHVVVASNLEPATPYELRAIATDAQGNRGETTINFISPRLRQSILQLILDSISRSFGWLSSLFGRPR